MGIPGDLALLNKIGVEIVLPVGFSCAPSNAIGGVPLNANAGVALSAIAGVLPSVHVFGLGAGVLVIQRRSPPFRRPRRFQHYFPRLGLPGVT